MNTKRQELIKKLEKATNADVYVLFTASAEMQHSIDRTFVPLYTKAVCARGKKRRKNAIVVLETDGGSGTVVMSLVTQLRECYENVDGYIFNRCYSAGTVGILATDRIFMSRYAFMGPVDTQFYFRPGGAEIKPLIANFHAFMSRTPDEREREFMALYPTEYLMAITDLNYDFQVIFPNFIRHFNVPETMQDGDLDAAETEEEKEFCDTLLDAWDYFDGGVGEHSANINRTKARELGMIVHDIPDKVEKLLMDIIDSYIDDTNMMVTSLSNLEEKNAYFETIGLSYVHYNIYKNTKQEIKESEEADEEAEDDAPKATTDKMFVIGKYCVERGWKQE